MSSSIQTATPMPPAQAPSVAATEVPPVSPRASAPAEPTSAQGLVVAPPPTLPSFGGPARSVEVAAAVNTLNAILDSFGSLLLAQQQLRTEGVERGTHAAEAGEASAESSLERQREAMEATERAQRRANGLLGGAPRWVKKLVAGLITAAGAVAGAFTGGVAAGLAIAGAVLILAGDAVSKLLVKAGVDPDKAMWVGFAVKVVGTALSLGAGAAGGAASAAGTASQAVRTATQVINTATKAVSVVNAGAQLGLDATAAAFNYQAERASANADEAGLELELAHDEQEDGVAALRDAHADYQRVVARMQTWLTTQQQTTSAMVAHLSA